jgi:hypothetical protein
MPRMEIAHATAPRKGLAAQNRGLTTALSPRLPQSANYLQRQYESAAPVAGSVARLPAEPSRPAKPWDRAVSGGAMMSDRGLVFPRRLSFDQWVRIGRELSVVCSSAAWCLGDWLVFGERAYAGRYREAIEQTSLDYQTLRNYAWVTKRFALSRRRDALSFGHHAEVAALPEPEQDFWLRKAEEHGWPVKELRRQVRASLAERAAGQHGQEGPGTGDWVILRLQIRVSPTQLQACQAAADQANLSIEEWAAVALEHATRHELGSTAAQPTRGQDQSSSV